MWVIGPSGRYLLPGAMARSSRLYGKACRPECVMRWTDPVMRPLWQKTSCDHCSDEPATWTVSRQPKLRRLPASKSFLPRAPHLLIQIQWTSEAHVGGPWRWPSKSPAPSQAGVAMVVTPRAAPVTMALRTRAEGFLFGACCRGYTGSPRVKGQRSSHS